MAKSTIKILRAFYREQDKEVSPDNTRTTIGTVENKDVLVTERTVPFQ